MAKYFKSKKIKRKNWLIKNILILIFVYIIIKSCIYCLVFISPSKFLKPSGLILDCYEYIKINTVNQPLNLLNYKYDNILLVEPVVLKDSKKVYVYSTHQSEAYSDNKNVINASIYLKEKLNEYNVVVKIEEGNISEFMNINNYSYNSSYIASRYFIESEINNNYDLIIDLHRDAVSRKNSLISINGKKYAKIMFVIGKKNKNYKKNYKVANEINNLINQKYPGLSRGVLLQDGSNVNGIYNQDLADNMLLIELGGNHNQFSEVKNTIDVLAPILGGYLYGNEIQGI